jgi:hypothetical protein
VRWEIELAINKDLPIVAVNLSNLRQVDDDLCPPLLREHPAVHVPFKMKIIQYALDNFPAEYAKNRTLWSGPRAYNERHYKDLGL